LNHAEQIHIMARFKLCTRHYHGGVSQLVTSACENNDYNYYNNNNNDDDDGDGDSNGDG
jgi:hypothetical protein